MGCASGKQSVSAPTSAQRENVSDLPRLLGRHEQASVAKEAPQPFKTPAAASPPAQPLEDTAIVLSFPLQGDVAAELGNAATPGEGFMIPSALGQPTLSKKLDDDAAQLPRLLGCNGHSKAVALREEVPQLVKANSVPSMMKVTFDEIAPLGGSPRKPVETCSAVAWAGKVLDKAHEVTPAGQCEATSPATPAMCVARAALDLEKTMGIHAKQNEDLCIEEGTAGMLTWQLTEASVSTYLRSCVGARPKVARPGSHPHLQARMCFSGLQP